MSEAYKLWFRRALQGQDSPNALERACLTLGVNEDNGSPFHLPLHLVREHMHVEGPPGSGKSAALAAILEYLSFLKEISVVVIDMKADSHELMGAARGINRKCFRWFTNRIGCSSHTMNIFEQSHWSKLDTHQQAMSIGTALGSISSMTGYGQKWFEACTEEVLQNPLERGPIYSLRGFSEAIAATVTGKNKTMPAEIRQSGLQAFLDTKRMGSVQPLGVVGNPKGIQLGELFTVPQTLYLSLPSAGNYALAGNIARLFLGSIFDAASFASKPRVPVIVVIDEWLRAVAPGLAENILTQARGCDVGLIVANQTLDDLDLKDKDLRPTMKACCRCHWQFGEGNPMRQADLAETGGTYDAYDVAETYSWWQPGWKAVAQWRHTTTTRRVVPRQRLPINEIKRVSSDPRLSFFTSSGDFGLYCYNGYPNIIETDFHITREEFDKRRAAPWPDAVEGCIVSTMPALLDDKRPPRDEEPPSMPRVSRPGKR